VNFLRQIGVVVFTRELYGTLDAPMIRIDAAETPGRRCSCNLFSRVTGNMCISCMTAPFLHCLKRFTYILNILPPFILYSLHKLGTVLSQQGQCTGGLYSAQPSVPAMFICVQYIDLCLEFVFITLVLTCACAGN
jgi:hypothetical protein